jgi:16S rRNA (cytosine1402-N4)-methyltransferase
MNETSHHVPILLRPIIDFLIQRVTDGAGSAHPTPPIEGVFIDCTLGGGGHTRALLDALNALHSRHRVIAFDQDPEAIARGRQRFGAELDRGELEIHHRPFSQLLDAVGGRPIIGLMADLGVSSDQIDSRERGFSFRYPAPLDMRMNTQTGLPLSKWLETISESELADVLWKYGEERLSRKIARRFIERRQRGEFPNDTQALGDLIASCYPPAQRHGRIHPATRSFQALRIAVNHELEELQTLIGKIFPAVAPRAHLAILSFHSLEDRLVKEEFRKSDSYELPSRKAIQADDAEVAQNPRSRSAKLRLAIKI